MIKYWNMMIKQWISGGPMVRYSASLQHLAALLKPEWLSTPAIAKNLKWLPQGHQNCQRYESWSCFNLIKPHLKPACMKNSHKKSCYDIASAT